MQTKEEVLSYLMKCVIAAYVETNDKFGFVGTLSERNIQIQAPTHFNVIPATFKVNINQVVLIKRPASFPAYTEKQAELNAKRLAQLKHMFETAVQGKSDLTVAYYAENYDTATLHYQISWYKGQK